MRTKTVVLLVLIGIGAVLFVFGLFLIPDPKGQLLFAGLGIMLVAGPGAFGLVDAQLHVSAKENRARRKWQPR